MLSAWAPEASGLAVMARALQNRCHMQPAFRAGTHLREFLVHPAVTPGSREQLRPIFGLHRKATEMP